MKQKTNLLIGVVALIVVLAVYWLFIRTDSPLKKSADMSEYSAVALNSNELFFGRISSQSATQLVLDDVYFFTFVDDPSASPVASPSSQDNLKPTLIDTNAANSLAPTSTYVISKDQIKYTYPLKKDSQVVKTIEDYKSGNK